MILKTSRFEHDEADGYREALAEANVAYRDLVWVSEPPPSPCTARATTHRCAGTDRLRRDGVLFTRGSVPVYRTYPGLRVPRRCSASLLQRHARERRCPRHPGSHQNELELDAVRRRAADPDRAARQVGKVLRHVPIGQKEATEYPYYM